MARQRFIWPSFWTDPALGRMPSDHRLLFVGCFSNADDEGRLLGDAAYLKSIVFPYIHVSVDEVARVRDELAALTPSYRIYEVNKVLYIALTRWTDYQKPKYPRPSKIPPPPRRKRGKHAPLSQDSSGSDSGNVSGSSSGNPSRNSSPKLPEAIPLRVGLGKNLNLKPKNPPSVPSVARPPTGTVPDGEVAQLDQEFWNELQRVREAT